MTRTEQIELVRHKAMDRILKLSTEVDFQGGVSETYFLVELWCQIHARACEELRMMDADPCRATFDEVTDRR